MKAETTEKIEVVTDLTKFEERAGAEPVRLNSPTAIMQMGAMGKWDPKLIMDMLEAQKAWDAHEAKKAYVRAITAFKADPPEIYKDKTNKQFQSRYTSIDALVNPAIKKLSEHGLSHSWDYGKAESGAIRVTCILTHEYGHSESVSDDAPPDTSGAKNALQERKSTLTYLKISTFEGVTGLVSKEGNLDDDGNAVGGTKFITPDQAKTINDIIAKKNIDIERFLVYAKAEKVEEILENKFKDVKANLDKAKAKPNSVPGGDDK